MENAVKKTSLFAHLLVPKKRVWGVPVFLHSRTETYMETPERLPADTISKRIANLYEKMTSNSFIKQPESMDEEEQRDALLFGQQQENPFENENKQKTTNDYNTNKKTDPSSRMAMIAIAVATVILTLMVVYRPESIDERVNTLNQLLRIGTGDSKGVLPPVSLPMGKAPPTGITATPSAPLMTQSGMKTTTESTTPGMNLSPPVTKSSSASTGIMSSSYNNQAAIATTGTMASSSSSNTNPMQAGNNKMS